MIHVPFSYVKLGCDHPGNSETVIYSDGDIQCLCPECVEMLNEAMSDTSDNSTERSGGEAE